MINNNHLCTHTHTYIYALYICTSKQGVDPPKKKKLVALEGLANGSNARMTKRQFIAWLSVDWQRSNARILREWLRRSREKFWWAFASSICRCVGTMHCRVFAFSSPHGLKLAGFSVSCVLGIFTFILYFGRPWFMLSGLLCIKLLFFKKKKKKRKELIRIHCEETSA